MVYAAHVLPGYVGPRDSLDMPLLRNAEERSYFRRFFPLIRQFGVGAPLDSLNLYHWDR